MAMSLLIMATLQAAQPQPPRDPLDWLVRDWSCRAERPASGPVWRVLAIERESGGLGGTIARERFSLGRRDTVPEARLRIHGGILLLRYPPAFDVATEYRLVESARGSAVFETGARVVPQRIAFRLTPLGMTVTMAQRDGSLAASTSYYRPGLRMAAGGC